MAYDPALAETLRNVKVLPAMRYSQALIDFFIAEAEAGTPTTTPTPQEAAEKMSQVNAVLLSSQIDCINAIAELDAMVTRLRAEVAALSSAQN